MWSDPVDDPAHYRWTSYRHNALGQSNAYLTPYPLYQAVGRDDAERDDRLWLCMSRSGGTMAVTSFAAALNISKQCEDFRRDHIGFVTVDVVSSTLDRTSGCAG